MSKIGHTQLEAEEGYAKVEEASAGPSTTPLEKLDVKVEKLDVKVDKLEADTTEIKANQQCIIHLLTHPK